MSSTEVEIFPGLESAREYLFSGKYGNFVDERLSQKTLP